MWLYFSTSDKQISRDMSFYKFDLSFVSCARIKAEYNLCDFPSPLYNYKTSEGYHGFNGWNNVDFFVF